MHTVILALNPGPEPWPYDSGPTTLALRFWPYDFGPYNFDPLLLAPRGFPEHAR